MEKTKIDLETLTFLLTTPNSEQLPDQGIIYTCIRDSQIPFHETHFLVVPSALFTIDGYLKDSLRIGVVNYSIGDERMRTYNNSESAIVSSSLTLKKDIRPIMFSDEAEFRCNKNNVLRWYAQNWYDENENRITEEIDLKSEKLENWRDILPEWINNIRRTFHTTFSHDKPTFFGVNYHNIASMKESKFFKKNNLSFYDVLTIKP